MQYYLNSVAEKGAPLVPWFNGDALDEYVAQQWNNAGSCISTLSPACVSPSPNDGHVKDAYELFYHTLEALAWATDTRRFLETENVEPIPMKVYGRDQLNKLLNNRSGFHTLVECEGDILQRVVYTFSVIGAFQNAQFVAPQSIRWSPGTSCPEEGIRYLTITPAKTQSDQKQDVSASSEDPGREPLKFFAQMHRERVPDKMEEDEPIELRAPVRGRDEL